MSCDVSEARNHRRQIKATVESRAELGEIARRVLVTDAMVCLLNRVLDVTEHGVDPGKDFLVDAGRTAAGDDGLVCTPGRRNAGEAIQTIGDDAGTARRWFLRPGGELSLAKALGLTQRLSKNLLIMKTQRTTIL